MNPNKRIDVCQFIISYFYLNSKFIFLTNPGSRNQDKQDTMRRQHTGSQHHPIYPCKKPPPITLEDTEDRPHSKHPRAKMEVLQPSRSRTSLKIYSWQRNPPPYLLTVEPTTRSMIENSSQPPKHG